MITKPTVLILGAGASMPYGYPSGGQLLQDIYTGLVPEKGNQWRKMLERCGIQQIMIDEFRQALYKSQQPSVDIFLERRPEFVEIGKMAIAIRLFECELEDVLFSFKNRNEGLYQYIFSKITANLNDFINNQLTIITFNYDRSLEHALFTSLKNTYNVSDVHCANLVSAIPIIHVHGSLGPLPWQAEDGRGYSPTVNAPEEIIFAGKRIIIISESQSGSPEFEKAFRCMSKADRIYFLGLSYHPANMQRLNVLQLPQVMNLRQQQTIDIEPQRYFGENKRAILDSNTPYYQYKWQLSGLSGSGYKLEIAEQETIQEKWLVNIPNIKIEALSFLRRFAHLD